MAEPGTSGTEQAAEMLPELMLKAQVFNGPKSDSSEFKGVIVHRWWAEGLKLPGIETGWQKT